MAMTNTIVSFSNKKQQSTSEYPSDLHQIKAIGVPISIRYIWKYESIKNTKTAGISKEE